MDGTTIPVWRLEINRGRQRFLVLTIEERSVVYKPGVDELNICWWKREQGMYRQISRPITKSGTKRENSMEGNLIVVGRHSNGNT